MKCDMTRRTGLSRHRARCIQRIQRGRLYAFHLSPAPPYARTTKVMHIKQTRSWSWGRVGVDGMIIMVMMMMLLLPTSCDATSTITSRLAVDRSDSITLEATGVQMKTRQRLMQRMRPLASVSPIAFFSAVFRGVRRVADREAIAPAVGGGDGGRNGCANVNRQHTHKVQHHPSTQHSQHT